MLNASPIHTQNPAILILDEATSALDAVSEAHMQSAIENVSVGRTVLTIAHRLSTIRSAQKIVVLDQGRISEYGTYGQLMVTESGMFRELIEKQTFAATPSKESIATSISTTGSGGTSHQPTTL